MIRIKKEIRTVLNIEIEPRDAEILCADIFYLLECTKDLAGMIPGGSVIAADDCRERLGRFLGELKKECQND